MKRKLEILFVVAVLVAVPVRAFAQGCSSSDLAAYGACAYDGSQECRDLYPSCTSETKLLSQSITQQDVLNSIVDKCCSDNKTTQQQKRCLKAKVNSVVLRLNLLKAVASNPFKPAIQSAIKNLVELRREGCANGSIVD